MKKKRAETGAITFTNLHVDVHINAAKDSIARKLCKRISAYVCERKRLRFTLSLSQAHTRPEIRKPREYVGWKCRELVFLK
jgi:hypothetical protein